jgi:hypothetical protein
MNPQLKKIYDAELLNKITSQINDWDFELVTGESVYQKIEKYAHIGIKIYSTDSLNDEVIFSVKETEIPQIYYSEIENVLSFFKNHVSDLKGTKELNLRFEIYEGSFNYDSNRNAFGYATIRALVNCFDQNQFKIDEIQRRRITDSKKNALKILRDYARNFSEEEIVESLLDESLTNKIYKTLNSIDIETIKQFLNQNANYELVENIRLKFLNEREYFTKKNILTEYEDMSKICYAQFCKILKDRQYLKYVGVFNLEKIEKYF